MALFKLGNTDIPVKEDEIDLFHIETYIDGLSTFIKECATPMTISIQGDWGSGKTSIMNMIQKKIKGSVCPIEFNTWQFSQFDMGNSLVFSMMEVVLGKLGYSPKAIAAVLQGVLGIAKRYAMGIIEETTHGAIPADIADGDNTNYANEIYELKNKFQDAVNNKIAKEKKSRVVIFVDDLDRLQPEKAVELLEVLKLFLDCENCVFVIAVDYDVVTCGIRQKYGLDVSEEKGKSFFDKIIQLPFKVPVAQYDIKNYVSTTLSNMNVKISTDDLELFVNLIKTSIGLNPRSMKRLFNSYQLLDIITRSSVTGLEENARRKILFAIICMQMGHERLYQYLAFNTVTAERLEQLVDPESSDECILKILDDENAAENDSRYMNRLNDFISYFYQSLQNDDDYDKISEGELADLQSVLKCSSVISLGEEESIDSSSESEDRYKNRMIAKKVNEQLSDLGNLKLWIPKKARGGVKRSDISAHLYFTAKNNFDFTLEYYLSRVPDGRITVYLMIYNKTSRQASVFFETLGENPLDLELLPEFEKGRIMYCEVITVTDDEAVEKISELYRKAYAAIQKFL